MNYYERHIGDYSKDTAHLSLLEHGVYSRLLDVYYTRESPIPADQVHRLIGCRTAQDRKACDAILGEFFELIDGAWRQSRCDAEIEKFLAGAPEREARAANQELRWKKHRRERAEYFKRLHKAGHHADWNIPIKELRALVERYCDETATESVAPATETATPAMRGATATHSQSPSSQSPYPNTQCVIPEDAHAPATPATLRREGNGSAGDGSGKRTESRRDPDRVGGQQSAEGYSDEAEHAEWEATAALYPPGAARVDWIAAEKAARQLVEDGVATWADLSAGVSRYAKLCTATNRLVLNPLKFFTDRDKPWSQAWPLPGPKPAALSMDELRAKYPEAASG